jgi:hypothetical protein
VTLLTPWSALIAAAVAVPLLLLLYFLRLRRQRLRVPSTLLWEKSFEDLQANALFQRLRWSLILLLQLILLAALLLALAQPAVRGETGIASRTVLLIDRSASMNAAIDGQRTRLDAAKDIARGMINALGRSDRTRQMMIVAFGATPQVVSVYESNRAALLDALNSITATDEQADLGAALDLAGAYAGATENSELQPPEVVLLSDGCVQRAGTNSNPGFSLRSGTFRFVQVEMEDMRQSTDNIGIATFSVRRDADDPARVLAFARVLNAGPRPVEVAFTLWVDDGAAAALKRTIPAATEIGPGEDSFTQALEVPAGAILSIRHSRRDQLAADDVAWLVLPAPARPRIALVHPNNAAADPFLEDLLAAIEPQQVLALSAEAWSNRFSGTAQLEQFDLAVFDRVPATPLPAIPSLTFGAAPPPLRMLDAPGGTGGQPILSWDRQHPLMRNVALDTIVYTGFSGFQIPAAATALAFGPDGPVVMEVRSRDSRHVVVGFEFRKSNWPLHVSSAVFMQNVIEYLTLARLGTTGLSYRAGDSVTVRAGPDGDEVRIEGPMRMRVVVEPGGGVRLPALRRAGLYTVTGAAAPFERIAVNVASDSETDIRPRDAVMVNAESTAARHAAAAGAQPLWPWLVAAALALLIMEWLIYCRRAAG